MFTEDFIMLVVFDANPASLEEAFGVLNTPNAPLEGRGDLCHSHLEAMIRQR